MTRETRLAWWAVTIAFVAISVYSNHVQTFWVKRGSDGKEYHDTAEQIAAGQTIRAETPYAYRIALPWLVAKTFPAQIARGFLVYNIAAAALGAALLLQWLLMFHVRPGAAALATTLYIASWIGPARFTYFYPELVDPPYITCAIGALVLMQSLRLNFSWKRVSALSALCFAGAFVRGEAMLFPPLAFLFANVRFGDARSDGKNVPAAALLMPLVFAIAGNFLVRQIPMEPRRVIGHEAVMYLLHNKPLFTLPLSFYLTFGPVIAVVLYDWRMLRDMAARHAYLFVFFGCCFLTSYVGGAENERYLVWAAPVMYLLIALALQRHKTALLRSAWVFVALAGAQALSEHIFFGIPDYSLSVNDWATLTTFGEKAWGLLNRLVIIDDYSWNIWSYFGSPPFHLLLLGIHVAFSAFLITYLWWAERGAPMRAEH